MKVSILIPLFNSEKYIEPTIKSALTQTWDNKEIIIVDDGSTDGSLSIARTFESEAVKVYSQPNRGAASARNLAFEYSTGDYIQYLDADDLLSDDKIARQMQIAAVNNYDPGVLIFGKTALFESGNSYQALSNQPVNKSYDDPFCLLTDLFSFVSFIGSHAYLTHRNLINSSGGWDEKLSANDDGEFFARVISKSGKVIFCDEGLSYYRRSISTSLSYQKSQKHALSEFFSLKKTSEIILMHNNNASARAACSRIFNWYIVEWFPANRFLLSEVEELMKRYGLEYYSNSPSRVFHFIKTFAGWRRAILFSDFYTGLKKRTLA